MMSVSNNEDGQMGKPLLEPAVKTSINDESTQSLLVPAGLDASECELPPDEEFIMPESDEIELEMPNEKDL